MKKLALLLIFILTIFQGFSQTKGISYQAVILNPEAQELPGVNAQGNILANTTIGIQFTIIDASGNEEYQENHTTSTDKYGMLNLLIGTGNPTSSTNFSEIVWDGTSKKLKVAIDFSGGSNYSLLSEQNLTYMPQPPTEQVSTAIETNAEAIINETIRAIAAEELNATDLAVEVTRATTAEGVIQSNVDANQTASELADATLTTDLAAEVLRATTAEGVNATVISAETTRATSAEQNNATDISTLQTEQTTQNSAIALNTAKTGITPAQAATIAATSGTNTGDQDISGIATNATNIATNVTAIGLNTAKVGITAQQASDITANNAKVSDVNHVTSSTTDNLTEGTTNLYYTEARVSANTAVAANTAKTGITPAQAATIAATSGTNTGDQDISGIATNATNIATNVTAIGLNTAKVGITAQQASDITANNAKVSDVNHVVSSTTDNLTEGTTNLYYAEARVSANTAVAANTAKTGITAQQASDITANTAKISVPTGGVIGDIIYNNGTDWVRLPKGTAGQVLAINAGTTAPEWVTTSASANVNLIQVSFPGTISSTSTTTPVGFTEIIFSKGSELVLNADGTISGLKAGRTYKITAHLSGRGTATSGLAVYNIYDFTSNADIGRGIEFIANSYIYTYSQKPSGISYVTPTVDTAVGLRSTGTTASTKLGTYTTFTVEEVR